MSVALLTSAEVAGKDRRRMDRWEGDVTLREGGLLGRIARVALGGRRGAPMFHVRVGAILGIRGGGTGRELAGPPDQEAQRAEVVAAFEKAFPEGGGMVPVEGGAGDLLTGGTTVRAPDPWAAWDTAIRGMRELLIENEAIADPGAVWLAMKLVHVEINEAEHANAITRGPAGKAP